MFNTALFDLDGVVLDTETQYTVCWDRIGKVYKPDIPHFAHLIKGQTLTQIFDRYFKDEEKVQHEIENQLIEFEKRMDYAYIPGVVAFIKDLKQHHVNTAIVTSSNQQKMANVYQCHPEFETLFDVILTSEDFKRSKPEPDCYLTAAVHFAVSHNQCVVFEDSINGLKAGKAAQMKGKHPTSAAFVWLSCFTTFARKTYVCTQRNKYFSGKGSKARKPHKNG